MSDIKWQALSTVMHAVGTLRLIVKDDLPPQSALPPELLAQITEQREAIETIYETIAGRPIGLERSEPGSAPGSARDEHSRQP